MRAIDKLIAKFCPYGVEYKPLGQVCEIDKGEQLNRDSLLEQGPYPVVNGGMEPSGYWDNYNFTANSITISQGGASAGYVNWIPSDFWAGAHCFVIVKCEASSYYRYVYHVLKYYEYGLMKSQVGAGIPSVSKEKLSQLSIPLPHIEVQMEIVRILDGFTGLIDELEAELAARRKQYVQYRDRILDFGDSNIDCCLDDVILSLNTGLNPRQFFKLNTKDAANYYVTIREIHDGKIVFSDKTDRINDTALSLCNNRSNLEVGDVLFSGTGTIGETAVIEDPATNWNIKEGVYAVKPDPSKVLPRYLHYAFMCSSVRKAYGARIFGGTVKSISMKDLRKIKIPVPSIPEQRRVVEILDRFDALCNDETAGLAAEIAARKKQYEYYRDRLLNFKRKEEGGNVDSAQRKKRNSPRKGGGYYTEDGMERLKRSGMKGHEAAERLFAEQIGERHRLLRPLTREAAGILKSVKGMIPCALFLSNAIVREAERRAKEEKT